MKKSLIQSTEQAVQEVVAPYLFGSKTTNISEVYDVIGPLFSVNLHILNKLHHLLSQKEQSERSPTMLARYVLWFHSWPEKLSEHYSQLYPTSSQVDRLWVQNKFDEWRNLWAGLQLSDVNWERIVSKDSHPLLGTLSGQDWLLLIEIHSQHQAKRIEHHGTNLD